MQSPRQVVLVVADDAAAADYLRTCLQDAGYVLRRATNGACAQAAISSGQADIIIIDLLAPDLDGLDLCCWVRTRAEGAYCPILMVVDGDEAIEWQAAAVVGADDYLTRPLNAAQVRDRVAVWARARQRLQQEATRARLEGVMLAARTMEHRLRNQLSLTMGYVDFLLHDPALSAGQHEAAREAMRGAEAMEQTLRRLSELTELVETGYGTGFANLIDLDRPPPR